MKNNKILIILSSFIIGLISAYIMIKILSTEDMQKKEMILISNQFEINESILNTHQVFFQNIDTVFYFYVYKEYEFVTNVINIIKHTKHEINNTNTIGKKFDNLLDIVSLERGSESIEYTILSSIPDKKTSKEEKEYKLNLIGNYLINDYLDFIYNGLFPLALIPIRSGEILNLTDSDTIMYGQKYNSKLIFSVQDVTNNSYFITNEGDTLNGGYYNIFPEKRGANKVEGNYYYPTLYGTHIFKFAIEYYVK